MNKKTFSLLCVIIAVVLTSCMNANKNSIIATDARLKLISDQFSFTEGPAADTKGNIYFTDQPNNKIWKYSIDGALTLFHQDCGRANGLYFDKNGMLLSCSDMHNELWSIDTQTGENKVLITNFDGSKLNGPNDLWITPQNEIYFTDPLYVRPYWERDTISEQPGEYVYFFNKNEELVPVASDLVKPNGIIGTPDGKNLYIADIGDNKTYRYDILNNGELANKTLFAPMGSDGMTIDSDGNIYLTGEGVTVYNKEGEQVAHIAVPEAWTANVCIGGENMNTLFITASKSLYSIELNVQAAK